MAKMTTFYLHTEEGILEKRTKKIFSPFNVAVMSGPPKFEMTYNEPKYVTFINGIYETQEEEEIKWLPLYNNIGGTITVDGKQKYFKGDGIHQVKVEKPQSEKVEITKEVTVEVSRIPRQFVSTLTVEQLKGLCKDWNVSFSEDTVTKDNFIALLDESGKIE